MYSKYATFNFKLPEELIAKFPVANRDESRLMIVNRKSSEIRIEKSFKEVLKFIEKNDALVFNSTKVSKRRVYLESEAGRVFEVVFLEKVEGTIENAWKCLIRNQNKLKMNVSLKHKKTNHKFTYNKISDIAILNSETAITESIFNEIGNIPIPPYLKRKATTDDETRYQTIFAKNPGSVAAPTAGLHFTEELRSQLIGRGVKLCEIELQIGYGTFGSLTEKNFAEKKLHLEKYQISSETSDALNQSRGVGRVISIGTTSLRALESSYNVSERKFEPYNGSTDLFILPEDSIHSIDGLITNFHLPGSSLLFLVSAFAGQDLILEAYRIAVKEKMRFFSYGDAMIIL